jgi:hypothetical protein
MGDVDGDHGRPRWVTGSSRTVRLAAPSTGPRMPARSRTTGAAALALGSPSCPGRPRAVDASGVVVAVPGYPGGPDWDAATGWGSPIASTLVPSPAKAARDDHARDD